MNMKPHNESRIFLLLCAVGCLAFVSYNLVRTPALAPFAQSLGAGPMAVGFIVAASTMTGIFLKLPMGALSDVVNRRRLMLLGVLAFALPPFIYPFLSQVEVLGLVRVVHGLATAIFTPLALATVAAMFPVQRGASLGWYSSATQGGALLAPPLAGWLVDRAGFAVTFETAGAIGLVALGLFIVILRSCDRGSRGSDMTVAHICSEMRLGLGRVIRHVPMWAVSLAEAAKMMANGALMAFLPLYGLSIGLSLAEGGLLFAIQGLTSFLSKPYLGRASDHSGRRALVTMGLMLCGATIMGIPHVEDFLLLLLLASGFGFGEALVTSSSAAFIADLSDASNLGAGMGLRGTIMDVGHASGPILAGVLVAGVGYTGAFGIMAGIQLVAAMGFWLVTGAQAELLSGKPTGGESG